MPCSRISDSYRIRTSPCTPPDSASTALARSSALARARPCPSTIASSSLSPSAAAPSRASFSRGRSCVATVFIVHHPCYTSGAMRRLSGLLCALLFCSACSEPPQKELAMAQGAIDAARAAGAEQYAREPLAAAAASLQSAHDAVVQRDYVLAL